MATQGRVEPGFLKDVQEHWSKFDTDQSHTISKAEFKKVMQELALQDAPFRLKAGMIGRLSVKVSTRTFDISQTNLLSLFSESVSIEVRDIHVILGTSRDNMSKPTDFSSETRAYDLKEPLTNIANMHDVVEGLQAEYRQ